MTVHELHCRPNEKENILCKVGGAAKQTQPNIRKHAMTCTFATLLGKTLILWLLSYTAVLFVLFDSTD